MSGVRTSIEEKRSEGRMEREAEGEWTGSIDLNTYKHVWLSVIQLFCQ